MRLFTHIKAFGEAANCLSTDTKSRTRPSIKHRPLSNITHEEFVITTPSDGVIARRRSMKEATTTTNEVDMDEKHPLLHADYIEWTPDPSPSAATFTFSVKPPNQHNPYFPAEAAATPHSRKRKRELDSIVKRVKSVKLSVNTKMLMDLFDDYENDMRRFQIRAPALEVEPLRDNLAVATSAEAMQRYGAVIQSRRDGLALGAY
ncbi:hypothetical protein Slin14017_G063460 [Septoria linicola]|nr:hypothetical protein Slin14017_G063460 [Septoria linicola]